MSLDLKGNIKNLQKRYEKSLQEFSYQLNELDALYLHYNNISGKIKGISSVLNHDVLVPLGDVAFFPGIVKHTNEFIVSLGENWFASKSNNAALEIIDRRLLHIGLVKERLEKEKRQVEEKLEMLAFERDSNSEAPMNEVLDILEDLDGNLLPESAFALRQRAHQLDSKGELASTKSINLLDNDKTLQSRLKTIHLDDVSLETQGLNDKKAFETDKELQVWLDKLEAEEEAVLGGQKRLSQPKSVTFDREVKEILTKDFSKKSPADIYDIRKPIVGSTVVERKQVSLSSSFSGDFTDESIGIKELASAYHRKQRLMDNGARNVAQKESAEANEVSYLGHLEEDSKTNAFKNDNPKKMSRFKANLLAQRRNE